MIHCVHAIIKIPEPIKPIRISSYIPRIISGSHYIIESLTKPRDLGSIPSHFPWLWSQDPTALLSASRWSLDGDRLAEHLAAVLRPSAEEAGMYLIFYSFLLESVTFGFNKLYQLYRFITYYISNLYHKIWMFLDDTSCLSFFLSMTCHDLFLVLWLRTETDCDQCLCASKPIVLNATGYSKL